MFNRKTKKELDPWDMPDTTCYTQEEHNTSCRQQESEQIHSQNTYAGFDNETAEAETHSTENYPPQDNAAYAALMRRGNQVKVLGVISIVLAFFGGGVISLLVAIYALRLGYNLKRERNSETPGVKSGMICAYIALAIGGLTWFSLFLFSVV
ncbi:MAG: hypothetical protein PHG02_05540 [Oscillospiraceae bacterium]|nr:hypothetical protein [Oscillospiraceae bacterium]